MSWSGATTVPNWAGNDNSTSGGGSSGSDVGNLYIVPDPPSIEENPNIGLEGRNEVPLPTKYRDFEVGNLTATTINGNPDFDASNWSLYRAISDVRGTTGAFSIPLYSISDFLNITAANNITAQGGNITAGVNVIGGVAVSAPIGGFNFVTAEDINVSFTNRVADVNIYGANLLPGDNALYVEGGTTLTGGGIIHGVVIGALRDPVTGFDAVRIDVLPVGMTLTSLTFIAITAAGAASLVAGGALALAGGDYITYNSDEHRFINTTSGNDFTDILVGNIHPAFTGSASLRINGGGSGRGVELADVKSINLWTELPIAAWVNSTSYVAGNKVKYDSLYYNCVVANAYTQPNIPIPNWVSASNYNAGTIVFSASLVYRCSSSVSGSTTPPASDPSNWTNLGYPTNAITTIWTEYFPYASTITGDELSSVSVGVVSAPAVGSNALVLLGLPTNDANISFINSASTSTSVIKQVDSTGEIQINTAAGLKIDTTTSTDFSAGDVVNLKNLTLTSALNPTWDDATTYALNDKVEWDGYNWRSEIAGNVGNIPQALLQPWLLSSNFVVGNVRYDIGANNSYLCIANVSGSTTPPSSDPTNWSFFQVGSDASDVWFQMNAVVESTIVGDRLSSIQIGQQEFVGEAGTYLVIGQDVEAVGTLDALVGSGGSLTLVGTDNVVLGALTGTATIVGDSVVIQTIPTTGGNILVEANEDLTMGAIQDASLGSTTGNVNITTIAGDIIVNSADALTLVSANNVALGSTAGDVNITSEVSTSITATTGSIAITSDAGNIAITSATDTSIVAVDFINIQAQEAVDIISNANTIAITSGTDTTITATAGDLFLVAGNDINLTAGAGDNVIVNSTLDLNSNNLTNVGTINGYNPPLTIYKNATIGSAISRAPATAEIQVYQQTMTLNADTQYMLNMSYAGLTENVSTATPNNNWYIIYRIHQGTTPLTTANLWGVAQLFNSTSQAGGFSASFMTTTSGTYTGRFYIRNQNATVSLTVANIQASVIEVV